MERLDRIVTRSGDGGMTALGDGRRVRKTHLRVEALGDLDELNCVLGIAALAVRGSRRALLESIQRDLFDVGADLAVAGTGGALRVNPAQVARIDGEATRRAARLRPLHGFVLPGGNAAAAWLHLARAVCRRAERRAWAVAPCDRMNPAVPRYLNRLSDLLFVLAREASGRARVRVPRSRR